MGLRQTGRQKVQWKAKKANGFSDLNPETKILVTAMAEATGSTQ